jgi:hypothetical protein
MVMTAVAAGLLWAGGDAGGQTGGPTVAPGMGPAVHAVAPGVTQAETAPASVRRGRTLGRGGAAGARARKTVTPARSARARRVSAKAVPAGRPRGPVTRPRPAEPPGLVLPRV